ncbi:MAG: hypothetical protein ACRDMZ_20615, partial [Solirubrobacteraceae bacterium]
MTAADSSGSGNHGALEGAAAWISGRYGGALRFDDGADVRVPSAASLQPARVTASAWVRRLGTPGPFRYVLSKGASSCMTASYG